MPALIYPGDRVTWKVLAEYSWSRTTTQSGSFLCTATSSTPIRVVTREVKYIHQLSLTLEHSMPISSPAAPVLTLAVLHLSLIFFPAGLVRDCDVTYSSFLIYCSVKEFGRIATRIGLY